MFRYREEIFALLAINAWELLLKARLLKEGANDPKVIRVYEPRRTKSGKASKKLYLKRNRAGSPMTVSLSACVGTLEKNPGTRLSAEIKSNLDALTGQSHRRRLCGGAGSSTALGMQAVATGSTVADAVEGPAGVLRLRAGRADPRLSARLAGSCALEFPRVARLTY
jgi:hypothetical protein